MTELRSADQLTDDELSEVGFADPRRARRLLVALAGRGVTDDDVAELMPSLLSALAECPDPDRSLANFVRWSDALVNRATHFRYLIGHPAGVRILVHIGATSQYLADILARNPEYAEILANPSVRRGAKPADELHRELDALLRCIGRPELKLDAMRRFRQREVLRIASRDLLGLADMPTTALDFSNLADVCIQHCYDLARLQVAEARNGTPLPNMAVLALGKLGGMELNYSSDIDLVFVTADTEDADTLTAAARVAELLIAHLGRETRSGHLFRVDTRLRPEGRFGPLVRTLSSYRSYFENWAETWERQAMLKARYVAGDHRVAMALLEVLGPFVYPRAMTQSMLNDIRSNKLRMERSQRARPDPARNVKVGIGGIRDVEFAVQLLQMRFGAADPLIRTPNTLEAIALLRQGGYLSAADAEALRDGYIHLRTVEHRLQLMYDRQTQDLPDNERELGLLARRLGYRHADEFREVHRRVTDRVRRVHERILHAEPETSAPSQDDGGAVLQQLALEVAAPHGSSDEHLAMLRERLSGMGFRDARQAAALVQTALAGTAHGREAPDAVAAFQLIMPELLQQCAHSPDPDTALHGLFLLAEASPNRAQWYRALRDAPALLQRLVRLAAGSRTLMHLVARYPEFLDLLVSDEIASPATKPADAFQNELDTRLESFSVGDAARDDPDRQLAALAHYARRERLRIGARDIWGETSAVSISAELTHLADAMLVALTRLAARRVSHAAALAPHDLLEHIGVIAMGKLGGHELSFYSDLDVVFVCSDEALQAQRPGTESLLYDALTHMAEEILALSRGLRQYGVPFQVDARLRPEGRFGPLVVSLGQLERYLHDRGEVWERQALIKARPIMGGKGVQAAFDRITERYVYGTPFDEPEVEKVVAMKRRLETERLRPGEQTTNIKLGQGGMSDIEFVTQLWQLIAGNEHVSVRTPGTIDALDALASTGILTHADAVRLGRNYRFLLRLRSRMSLQAGQPMDTLPSDAARMRALALGFGTTDSPTARAEDVFRRNVEVRMQETRRIYERLFRAPSKRARTR